jgi:AcrR family transcriptional regulator
MGAPEHDLRKDARRNRAAILDAAAHVFAEQGTDVPLEEIARAAGVGIATLYRRFPTRDALVEATLEDTMRRYADRTDAALERAQTDPWGALADYVQFICAQQAADPAFSDALQAPLRGSALFAEDHARAFRSSVRLIHKVKAAGVVRPDLDHSDLYLLTLSNGAVARVTGRSAPDAWRRVAGYFLDGFRADDAPRPTLPPPDRGLRPSRSRSAPHG